MEPRIVRKNREMAFRSIIKLCYKCHPSSGMEFMHTYYYPGNSKSSADPLAWKQYNLSFSFYPNSFWAIKFKNSNVHYNLWGCSTSNSFQMVCSVSLNFFFFLGQENYSIDFFLVENSEDAVRLTWLSIEGVCQALQFLVSFWLGWAAGVTGILAQYLIAWLGTSKTCCLTRPKGFCKNKLPLIISTTKVKQRLFLQRQSYSQMAHSKLTHFSWTNEDLFCLYPEGRSSEVKEC